MRSDADEPSALRQKIMFTLLFEATNVNFLLGFMPESLGLLLFGFGLIGFAVSLRRIFNRSEKAKKKIFSAESNVTVG